MRSVTGLLRCHRWNASRSARSCEPGGRTSDWSTSDAVTVGSSTRWTYYDVAAHRSQFTPASLDLLMQHSGWTCVARPRMVLYEMFGALQSLVNTLRPHNRLYESLKRGRAGSRRADLLGDALVAVVMGVPALLLAVGGLAARDRASCVNAVYRRAPL